MKCVDCNCDIQKTSKRCKSCHNKNQKVLVPKFCVDCNCEISRLSKERCRSCHNNNQRVNEGYRAERTRFNNSDEWKLVRKQCYERDGYTCQFCKTKGGTLHPHHIVRWADDKSLALELSNLITLCKACHMYVHHNKGPWG